MYVVSPYNKRSKSAKRLYNVIADTLSDTKYNSFISPEDVVINWGSTRRINNDNCLNPPQAVKNSCNKIKTFAILQRAGVPTPKFTTEAEEAKKFTPPIFVRHFVSSHSGKGIEICTNQNIPEAKLYTEGIDKKKEYRVIVVGNKAPIIMRKIAREETDNLVWNLKANFRFRYVKYPKSILQEAKDIAIRAVKALNLDFGAVDIVLDQNDKLYVLETNTAFGLGKRNQEIVGKEIAELASNLS